jgi:tRNA U34 5-carboxymethylaminomethyl modifying enzyme MnmG/GidA
MEITYFALGMLSMVALTFVGVVVWGLFRVSKIERQIGVIKQNDRLEFDNVQRQFENVYRSIDNQRVDYRHEFESVFRRFETIEENSRLNTNELVRTMDERFNKMEQDQFGKFHELYGMIIERHTASTSYTDKRVDKLLNQKEVL